MSDKVFDVIVVGAGFAGLCASYYLKQHGLKHLVFERGKIAESWRSQRWDSFQLNSTNILNILPGMNCEDLDPDGFDSAKDYVSRIETYVAEQQLPVEENSKVIAAENAEDLFHISVLSNNTVKKYISRQLLIASGSFNEIKFPSFAKNVSRDIKQLHAGEYRNSNQLPDGAVLVVGSAQSGIQIARDLLDAGRELFLATSKVARIPRWYRGRDIFYWLKDLHFFDLRAEDITDPEIFAMKPPQISGGKGRDTISLQSLAKKGAVILGKIENAESDTIFLQPNAALHVKFADGFSQKIKQMIDEYINKNQLSAPAPHYDETDIPDPDAKCASSKASLNLKENNIRSVIWATGFDVDHSYIKLPVFDSNGKLKHKNGIPEIPGFYFLGYPWLRSRKSAILFGIAEDAEFIVDRIYENAVAKEVQ